MEGSFTINRYLSCIWVCIIWPFNWESKETKSLRKDNKRLGRYIAQLKAKYSQKTKKMKTGQDLRSDNHYKSCAKALNYIMLREFRAQWWLVLIKMNISKTWSLGDLRKLVIILHRIYVRHMFSVLLILSFCCVSCCPHVEANISTNWSTEQGPVFSELL